MLLGEYDHTLDDKNRLTLPAKLRDELGDMVVITRGLDGNLDVYSAEAFGILSDRLGALDAMNREARLMRRHIYTGAPPVELDKQGRMVVPSRLLEEKGIGREVTVAAVGDHLEIWDRATWREQLKAAEGSVEDAAERLANRN